MTKFSVQLDLFFDNEVIDTPGRRSECETSFRELMDDIFEFEDAYIKTEASIKEIREVIG